MQIRERKTAYWALLAAVAKREADAPRPSGLHLSTIVDDYAYTIYPQLRSDGTDLGLMELFWEFGNAWEAALIEGLRELDPSVEKPAPIKKDGVWCSLDGWSPASRRVHETKLTWTSVRDGASHPKVIKYFYQGIGYCYAMETTALSVHVGYVRGNYRETLVDLKTYCPVLSERDVEKHWTKLMRHAEDRGMR